MTSAPQRTAVVTGSSRGIGHAVARALAQDGMRVVLASRHAGAGEAAAERLTDAGMDVLFHVLDVGEPDSVATFGEFVRSRCGRADVLVNNAGVMLERHDEGNGASVLNTSLDTLQATLATNLYGPLLMAQELVPLMKQAGYGRVVNVSSGLGQLSEMGGRHTAYRVSKTALNALTRILAAETDGFGILVNSVCPGWVRTDMGGPSAKRSPEEAAAGIVWAATLPGDGPSGGFFRDGERLAW